MVFDRRAFFTTPLVGLMAAALKAIPEQSTDRSKDNGGCYINYLDSNGQLTEGWARTLRVAKRFAVWGNTKILPGCPALALHSSVLRRYRLVDMDSWMLKEIIRTQPHIQSMYGGSYYRIIMSILNDRSL